MFKANNIGVLILNGRGLRYSNFQILTGGMQRPLMSVFEILAKLTLSLMVINGH